MKFSLASDLHLEFHTLELHNVDNSDVLILAGDIANANEIKRYPFNDTRLANGSKVQLKSWEYRDFFSNVSKQWKHVIYVAGNHEHYGGTFEKTDGILRDNLAMISDNIHYLSRDTFILDDVVFVGATFWTDINKADSLTAFHLSSRMTDYSVIRTSSGGTYRKLQPRDTSGEHYKSVKYLEFMASEHRDKKLVVVSHHAPSHMSISPYYKGDFLMNGGYCSDLSETILDNENIKYWVHGHVHDDFDYPIGETRVVCNPRGYAKYEQRVHSFALKTLEV